MAYEQLKLENQICFPLYATSHLITREYQPYLDKLGVTYPQYLVLILLWEYDEMTINHIAEKLILKTNTVTPLLKRMEALEIVERERDTVDSRKVYIRLTEHGMKLREKAASIPKRLGEKILSDEFTMRDLMDLQSQLYAIIERLNAK
ncbi:MAG: MarR family transcriptional regulator [Bacteroidales bacterium]|jgi:DNA-binding MarR family transcriptional regulator|nr:MarR family transcriptional regulator [Bacteroidales bacterium]